MQDPSILKINSKDYKILARIGEGSFGKVYKAQQFQNNQTVAIKVQNRITESEKQLVNVFLKNKFKNLVNIFDYEEQYEQQTQKIRIIIVMEYCRVSLYDYILKNPLKPKDARYVMKEIINGIEELHKLGLAHRDIKPENILIFELEDQGRIQEIYKICDFGTTKEFDKLVTKQVGTPYYLAPEQIQNNQQELYSESIDIWAFGSVMYELFTRTPLFNGNTAIEIYDKIMNLNINEKIDSLIDLDFKYKQLLKQMLNRNPQYRIKIQEIKNLVNEVKSISVDKKPKVNIDNTFFKEQKLKLKPPTQVNQSFNNGHNLQNPQFFPQNLNKQNNIQNQRTFINSQNQQPRKPICVYQNVCQIPQFQNQQRNFLHFSHQKRSSAPEMANYQQ